jgi:hypothetical protein
VGCKPDEAGKILNPKSDNTGAITGCLLPDVFQETISNTLNSNDIDE